MTRIQVDKRCDLFPAAVFIDSISIVGGIQKEFLNPEFRKVCFHRKKGMQKRKHVVSGSPFQKRKYGEIAVRIGCHIHVEMVTEEIAFPMGVPSPVAVRLGIMAFAVTGGTSFLLTIADPFFSLLCGGADRSTVTGKGQMHRIDQPLVDGTVQKLLLIETENKEKRVFRFQVPTFQQRKKFGSRAGRITGSLIAFLFSFGRLHFRKTIFRGKIVAVVLPDAGKEIIKSPDAGSVPERETAEDGIKGSFPEHTTPDRDGSYLQLQSKQIGTQHTGRKPWFGAKDRITLLHKGISQGKIEIPKLHDIVPGAFGKHKGIGIKLKKIGYESILIGGMAARITR